MKRRRRRRLRLRLDAFAKVNKAIDDSFLQKISSDLVLAWC